MIVLTMGNRPRELDAAIRSARRQVGVGVEVVVVGNGTSVDGVDADHRVELPENVGIPEGRNIGMATGHHEFACFLDDDAEFMGDDVLARALGRLADDSDLAVIGLRLVDEALRSDRRHDPRLRTASHSASRVTSFPGGACVVRGSAFDAVGARVVFTSDRTGTPQMYVVDVSR